MENIVCHDRPVPPVRRFFRDPRVYQIAALTGLLVYGVRALDFEIGPAQAAVTLATVLARNGFASRLFFGESAFEPRSALISGLSLCLLLRTNSLWLAAAGAGAAVGSKFLLRWRGKHLFNPTNFALVLLLCARTAARGCRRGNGAASRFSPFCLVCLGGLVVSRAGRADVALAFLAFYLGLLFARSAYLGEPLAIPLHRMQSGTLLLFAFFMISDPRTTPDSRVGRIVFALLVAFGGVVRAVPAFPHQRTALEPRARARCSCRCWTGSCPATATAGNRSVLSSTRPEPDSHPMKSSLFTALACLLALALTPTPSAASTSPRPTPSFSTRPPRSCWCARTTRPC